MNKENTFPKCQGCNVPIHLHGTACGWINAHSIIYPLSELEKFWNSCKDASLGIKKLFEPVSIKLDRTTLPKDGQGVKFQTQDEEWHIGYFIDGENMFWIREDKWHYANDVLCWENNDPAYLVEIRLLEADSSTTVSVGKK